MLTEIFPALSCLCGGVVPPGQSANHGAVVSGHLGPDVDVIKRAHKVGGEISNLAAAEQKNDICLLRNLSSDSRLLIKVVSAFLHQSARKKTFSVACRLLKN